MELQWIEDFLTLAECGSFSRAAEQRNVTQPAFSRRIRSLEHWVGTELIDRSSHHIKLTPAGQTFMPAAAGVKRRLLDARDVAKSIGQAASKSHPFQGVSVGAGRWVAAFWLAWGAWSQGRALGCSTHSQ